MVFGGVNNERIQFNEETVWDGVPTDYNNPEALKNLPEVRRLLFEGKNDEATRLAGKTMMGSPKKVKSYQTLGDLFLDFDDTEKVSGYRRCQTPGQRDRCGGYVHAEDLRSISTGKKGSS